MIFDREQNLIVESLVKQSLNLNNLFSIVDKKMSRRTLEKNLKELTIMEVVVLDERSQTYRLSELGNNLFRESRKSKYSTFIGKAFAWFISLATLSLSIHQSLDIEKEKNPSQDSEQPVRVESPQAVPSGKETSKATQPSSKTDSSTSIGK